MPVSPGASGMQPRDPCRPWRGTLASGHKPRGGLLALPSLESNPQLSFATRMEDWTCLGQHKRQPEFPVVTRESRRNSRKTTWLPRHRKMKPFPSPAPQEKSHVRNWRSKGHLAPLSSLSAGYGLKAEQAWPALLQSLLRREGFQHTGVNASVSGETTAGGRSRLPQALAEYKPSVVVLELGFNDGLRGLPIPMMPLGPPLEIIPEGPPSSRDEGLRLLHGL